MGPLLKEPLSYLKLSRFQTRQVTGLLTGHYHLRGHLFKLGKVNNTIEDATMKQKQPHISFMIVRP
jgi:hypothetical protein